MPRLCHGAFLTGKASGWRFLQFGLLCCFLLNGSHGSDAQSSRFLRHQAWSTEEGLPQNSVHQILQARDGFLWIATEGGLSRFDGWMFQTFSHINEVAFTNDDVCCLVMDTAGSLWIGTADGLLVRQGDRFRRFTEGDGLPSSSIQSLRCTPEGVLLITTRAGVVRRRDDRFTPPSGLHDFSPVKIPGAAGDLWSFSPTTVLLKQPSSQRQWMIGADLPGSRIETLFIDRQGTAWVGTNRGLVTLDASSKAVSPVTWLQGNSILQIFEDQEGNYWIGTETSGLHVLRPSKFKGEPLLADQAVTAIVESTAGHVWVGTRQDGLKLLGNGKMTEPASPNRLTSQLILSLAPGSRGSVFAGTPDGLNLVELDGHVRQITSAEGLPDDYIQALASDGETGVWIGTRRGLVHYRNDGVWRVYTKADGLGGDLVGALLRTKNGDLWVGTSGGLTRIRAESEVSTYSLSRQLDGIVATLAEDPAGGVWIGTSIGQLSHSTNSGLEGATVLPGNPRIAGLLQDQHGYLWIRTGRGIDRVAVHDLVGCFTASSSEEKSCDSHFSHYRQADGLASVEVVPEGSPAVWSMGNGELWFATRRGIAVADPNHLPINSVPAPVIIERFLADDLPLRAGDAITEVPFGYLRFTIEYAGLSYTAPSEVRYRYKLEGLDQEWTDAGARRSATYTNLRPRLYHFRVQAMNNDGLWNEAGATLAFRVVPPFYRRLWFLFTAALCLALLFLAGYRLRLRRLQAQFNAVLGERNRMAREIHDTLAQDFVGVSLQLDIVSHLLASKKPDAAMQQVQQTRRLVTEGLAEARQSIWELRANLAHDSLPKRLARVVERCSDDHLTVKLKLSGAYRPLETRLETEVTRIAQEALTNVRRHANAKTASVDLRYETDRLLLTVKDAGTGFVLEDRVDVDGHYGLKGMQERADSLHGTLSIDTRITGGTTVTLSVPVPSWE